MSTIVQDKPKIYKVADRLYLGIAGLATDAQTIVQRMTFRTNLYELRENRKMSPRVFTTMISNLLYERRFGPYFSEPVIAGLDPVTSEPYLSGMDLIGCITTPKDFVATGTAAECLMGICESTWEPDMEPEPLFQATSQALLAALERDAGSGWGAVCYLITPDRISIRTLKPRLD